MKAAITTAYGPPGIVRIGKRPDPEPKRGEIFDTAGIKEAYRLVSTHHRRGNAGITMPQVQKEDRT